LYKSLICKKGVEKTGRIALLLVIKVIVARLTGGEMLVQWKEFYVARPEAFFDLLAAWGRQKRRGKGHNGERFAEKTQKSS